MLLGKWIPIVKVLIKMEFNKAIQFKVNTFFEIMTSLCYLIINLFFWGILFNIGYSLKGWNYSDIIVFIAFSELFFGLQGAIFTSLSRYWMIIVTGQLDTLLVRPIDSRIRIVVLNIDYIEVLRSCIFFIALIIYSGKQINPLKLVAAIVICLISLYVFGLIQLTISYLAFFWGKIETLNELSDSLTVINKYPLTIFPAIVFKIMRFVVPFLFFSTFPAQLINKFLDYSSISFGISGLIFNVIIWSIINKMMWKRGLSRYESYNG